MRIPIQDTRINEVYESGEIYVPDGILYDARGLINAHSAPNIIIKVPHFEVGLENNDTPPGDMLVPDPLRVTQLYSTRPTPPTFAPTSLSYPDYKCENMPCELEMPLQIDTLLSPPVNPKIQPPPESPLLVPANFRGPGAGLPLPASGQARFGPAGPNGLMASTRTAFQMMGGTRKSVSFSFRQVKLIKPLRKSLSQN